ncbi:ABC transporter ATP-binding protein [Cohaesibacter marisflavi]|uniref:ABC transporter ATP-binding protein n=1 Tax=Cohaesibacter marisflavi TaxID=655353 RepID=UPI0029C708D5|nr:ATP-binding cassette domain-containing protein [Cohaesibacter marisflavi]
MTATPQTPQNTASSETGARPILSVKGLTVGFSSRLVLENLDLDVQRGEILGIVGASGTGKSVLLRSVLGLVQRQSGQFIMFGHNTEKLSRQERLAIERRLGVLFQHGALFSSLSVLQNIQVPMREYYTLPQRLMDELAISKLELVGLSPDAAHKFPSELSGGMIKRAALARALALDPQLLFLDEPTSGLDPISAEEFDDLISTLRDTLGLTVFMVTHDLDSLSQACDRIAVLAERRVLAIGNMNDLQKNPHPWIKSYFTGKRAIRQWDKN